MPLTKKEFEQITISIKSFHAMNLNNIDYVIRDNVLLLLLKFTEEEKE